MQTLAFTTLWGQTDGIFSYFPQKSPVFWKEKNIKKNSSICRLLSMLCIQVHQQTINWWHFFFFFTFPRKQDLTFHANCLQRQFAWKVKTCFLGEKIKIIFQYIVCWKFYSACKALNCLSLGIYYNVCHYRDWSIFQVHIYSFLMFSHPWMDYSFRHCGRPLSYSL